METRLGGDPSPGDESRRQIDAHRSRLPQPTAGRDGTGSGVGAGRCPPYPPPTPAGHPHRQTDRPRPMAVRAAGTSGGEGELCRPPSRRTPPRCGTVPASGACLRATASNLPLTALPASARPAVTRRRPPASGGEITALKPGKPKPGGRLLPAGVEGQQGRGGLPAPRGSGERQRARRCRDRARPGTVCRGKVGTEILQGKVV